MNISRRPIQAVALVAATCLVAAACGAGSRTASETAAEVECDFDAPAEATDVNVLAYNSSAIDPFTNTMVKSCSKDNTTLQHEPVDFAGQVQKTTASLAGDTGTYDILETYSFILPELASQDRLQPLDELWDEHAEAYGLDALNEDMRQAMTYDGQLFGLPMQAQMFVMVYREDVFEDLGIEPPTTFDELTEAAETIQQETDMQYPLALPWLASADIVTAYDAAMGSLGADLTDPDTMEANLDGAESKQALESMLDLKPFMDPEVTTFDQPAVQQQMYNGSAAMSIMFSGRMNDLSLESNSQFADSFAFAAPPSVDGGDFLFNSLSVDGWSIPHNTDVPADTLFQMIASSVSEDASEASIPAAYPAREGAVTDDSSPYAAAATESLGASPPAEPYPWTSQISNEITPIVAEVVLGRTSVDDGAQRMQAAADKILAEYR
ncbi:ABC transporter substrate-binding protein [Aeromicrobium sp. CF4.19]|uniref:ABC transporter substrate-binding protein n=1 Tax=Aeromicrobium sp. CF4.19 TaxID=3373082 RepID=UPI003EE72857